MFSNAQRQNSHDLLTLFRRCREYSINMVPNLEAEDFNLQPIDETSPLKWHLAHTSWFFETFVLIPFSNHYQPFNRHFEYLFNSYYNGVGQPFKRSQRHLLSRPSLEVVYQYRRAVDTAMFDLLASSEIAPEVTERVLLGLQHEQQHQELMLTDIKYSFFQNPMFPAALDQSTLQPEAAHTDTRNPIVWQSQAAAMHTVGHNGVGFSFDNERPQHAIFLGEHAIADRMVSNAEYLDFVTDRGYQRSDLWLSDGWAYIQNNRLNAPLYWLKDANQWHEFTLYGLVPLDPNSAVSHLSYYEADAFARWYGARLPSEFEWEVFAHHHNQALTNDKKHPLPQGIASLFNHVWQWTQSAYLPYPGFKKATGTIGEYNGKFMCNQMVLRGGSCLSPPDHIRSTYRNFFYPDARWQMSGIRLAKDCQ